MNREMTSREQYYSQYTFEQLGEAYETEQRTRIQLNKQLNDEHSRLAAMKYDRDIFMEKYLRLHIEKHVKVEGDIQADMNGYFNDRTRQVHFTPSGSYICTIQMEDCVFVVFCWANKAKFRQESIDLPLLLKSIQNTEMRAVRWTGVRNVLSNHSIEIEPNLWELKL